ncbi:hypothetical protein MMC29_004556 [Sticta canariensis]|nr:hypothetical protein [Sticta canariensis]
MTFYSDVNRINNLHDLRAEYGSPAPVIGGSHQYTELYQPHNNDFMSDDQVNHFDFDPPSASPFREHPLSPDHTDPFFSWNNCSPHPLSPPNSALFSSPKNRGLFVPPQAPPNILTSIDPASTRAQCAPVTPPDDENPVHFSPLYGQLQRVNTAPAPSVKKRKRLSATMTQTSRRTRKNASLSASFDPRDVDPNSPEQVRRLKFLERNRVAASKCRQKKKEWIDKTEAQARELHSHNTSLHMLLDSLKNEILYVKAQVVRHMDCEGSDIKAFIEGRPDSFADAIRTYEQYEQTGKLASDDFPLKQEDPDEADKDSEDVPAKTQPSSPASADEHKKLVQALRASELGDKITEEVAT